MESKAQINLNNDILFFVFYIYYHIYIYFDT